MRDDAATLEAHIRRIAFGGIHLDSGEKELCLRLNHCVLDVLKSLPNAVQTDALLELMNGLGLSMRQEIDFFQSFYTPAWSILYWLQQTLSHKPLFSEKPLHSYHTIHTAAMLLHLIDDHLHDGELAPSHLALLLRSQLWLMLNRALNNLGPRADYDQTIALQYIDSYYAAVVGEAPPSDLESYCRQFQQQMGMGYIAPVLMTKALAPDQDMAQAVETALGAFGTAWRLLDDIQDLHDDMAAKTKSAVYFCLPENIQALWDCRTTKPERERRADVSKAVTEQRIIGYLVDRICRELDKAAAMAVTWDLHGYADELSALAAPLRKFI